MSHLESIQKINVPRVPLDRDTFRRNFTRELAGGWRKSPALMSVGLICVFGQVMGNQID
jgi:hypothetical protein